MACRELHASGWGLPGTQTLSRKAGRELVSRLRPLGRIARAPMPVSSVLAHSNGSVNGATNGSIKTHDDGNESISESAWKRTPASSRPVEESWSGKTFFSSEAAGDPDQPSPGMSPVGEAIAAIARGEMVVVVDDENRENEGDLIMAGALATAESMAFIVKHTSGLVCAAAAPHILDRLEIPLMVNSSQNEDAMRTAFTVSVDLREGTTTGISAADRARTIRALSQAQSIPSDFRRPGHVFPLRYREGGVLRRPGHTEAAVDLAVAAGLPPVGILCEVVDPEDPQGSMARLPRLREFAKEHGLHIISIEDLIRYRRKRESIVQRTAAARLPTKFGNFQVYSYTSSIDGIEHAAIVKGNIGDGVDVLARLHSECLTGDIFASLRCDCGPQLHMCLERLEREGRGVCVYLRGHEGRGIGLGHKLQAYNLQDEGRDTVDANLDLGLPADAREYTVGAQILADLGVRSVRLMTNNPAKFEGIKGHGIAVTGRVPLLTPVHKENRKYLEAKRQRMGHVYGSDLQGAMSGLIIEDAEEAGPVA